MLWHRYDAAAISHIHINEMKGKSEWRGADLRG